MKLSSEIIELFEIRDKAVDKQDKNLFISTQIAEIENGGSEGYLSIDRMKTEVFYAHKESELETIVFVKETYSPRGKDSYHAFIVYFLTNTIKGWKIYKLR